MDLALGNGRYKHRFRFNCFRLEPNRVHAMDEKGRFGYHWERKYQSFVSTFGACFKIVSSERVLQDETKRESKEVWTACEREKLLELVFKPSATEPFNLDILLKYEIA